MRCPSCVSIDNKVVDSRAAEEGVAIRRRRECLDCNRRFTTYERIDEAPVFVLKRSGLREPFDRAKVLRGLRAATKNRSVSPEQLESVAIEVEESVRLECGDVASLRIGMAVLERLRVIDGVAFVRFASIYKGFTDPGDFEREVQLLAKSSAPKSSVTLAG